MDGKLKRHIFIGKEIRNFIFEKGFNLEEIGKKMRIGKNPEKGKSQSYVSQVLAGKPSSDEVYIELSKIIGLYESKLKDIFKQADDEVYFQKYGVYPGNNSEPKSEQQLLNTVFKMNGHRMSESDMRIIQSVIDGSDEL